MLIHPLRSCCLPAATVLCDIHSCCPGTVLSRFTSKCLVPVLRDMLMSAAPWLLQGEYAKGYGTVLDSGTTFTYLPTAAFSAFLGLLTEALQHRGLHRSSGADPQVWAAPTRDSLVVAIVHACRARAAVQGLRRRSGADPQACLCGQRCPKDTALALATLWSAPAVRRM